MYPPCQSSDPYANAEYNFSPISELNLQGLFAKSNASSHISLPTALPK